MTANPRAELLQALAELSRIHPAWRFGQLICNVMALAGETVELRPEDVGDEALLRFLRGHLDRQSRKPPHEVPPDASPEMLEQIVPRMPRHRPEILQALDELGRATP